MGQAWDLADPAPDSLTKIHPDAKPNTTLLVEMAGGSTSGPGCEN